MRKIISNLEVLKIVVTLIKTSSDHQIFHPNNSHLLHIQMELCLKTLDEVIIELSREFSVRFWLKQKVVSLVLTNKILFVIKLITFNVNISMIFFF